MKLCTKCNKEFESGQYCPECGEKLIDEDDISEVKGDKNLSNYKEIEKPSMFRFIIIIVCIIVASIIIGMLVYMHSKNISPKISTDNVKEFFNSLGNDESQEQQNSGDESSVGNNGDNVSGQVNPEFQVYSGVEEDYANALQPEDYHFYDSGITDFSFYYPDNLYCDVTTVENEECEFGFLIKKIDFIGSNGSELIYQLIQRTDSLSLEAETDYIYNKEIANLYEKEDIVFSTKDNYGKVIVTGWDSADKNYVIYNLCKIEDDYILQMKVIYPNYTGDLDTAQKGYVTECYYRLCGFSDSTLSVRSYEEYMNEN